MNYNKIQYENTIYVSRETYMSLQLSWIEHTPPKVEPWRNPFEEKGSRSRVT